MRARRHLVDDRDFREHKRELGLVVAHALGAEARLDEQLELGQYLRTKTRASASSPRAAHANSRAARTIATVVVALAKLGIVPPDATLASPSASLKTAILRPPPPVVPPPTPLPARLESLAPVLDVRKHVCAKTSCSSSRP